MSLYESRSSKRSKPIKGSKSGDAGGDASLFTIVRTTDQLETTEVEAREEDITRPVRSCVSNPSRP